MDVLHVKPLLMKVASTATYMGTMFSLRSQLFVQHENTSTGGMMSQAYDHARETLELAIVGYYWQLHTQLTRESKEFMINQIVKSTVERLR